jgi:hypothetical protein
MGAFGTHILNAVLLETRINDLSKVVDKFKIYV